MKTILPAALALLLAVAACAPQPVAPPAPPPPPPAPPPTAPPPGLVSAGVWNVERVRCLDLLGAAEDDRAAALMFYYGYLAAKAGIHIIDVGKIDGNIAKVMRQCEAAPNMTVPQAFRLAIRRRG
jgi:HdeA/HdeB family protein